MLVLHDRVVALRRLKQLAQPVAKTRCVERRIAGPLIGTFLIQNVRSSILFCSPLFAMGLLITAILHLE